MTEGERQILNEISNLRKEVNTSFKGVRDDHRSLQNKLDNNTKNIYDKISKTDDEVSEVKGQISKVNTKVEVNRTKITIYLGIAFTVITAAKEFIVSFYRN